MNSRVNSVKIRVSVTAAGLALATGAACGQAVDLARVREAMGISHLAEYPGVKLTGTSVMAGLPLTFTMIFDGKGRYIERFEGAITIASGFDGTTAWSHDIGGEERVLDLVDRQRAIAMAGMMTGWWLDPRSGSELAPGAADGTLEWHTESGGRGLVTIDAETGRPSKWNTRTVMGNSTITLSGEVKLGSVVFPAEIHNQGEGLGAVRITKAEAWTPQDSDFAPKVGLASDTQFDMSLPAGLVVTRTKTGHLLVKVDVNGEDAGYFIFDTGAGGTVISTALVEKLGLEKFGQLPMVGVGGTIMTSFVQPQSMRVGPMTIHAPLMTTLDTGFLTVAMGAPISGIVGYGLMHRAIIEVERATPRIALHDPRTYTNAALKWEEMRITGRVPVAHASFEGHEGWFRLDTGASGRFLTMHYQAVRDLKLLEGRELTDTKMGGVGGMVPGKVGTLAWFEIGGRRSENVQVEFATQDKGAFADEGIMGNLGGEALAGFDIFFDYQGKRIAFEQVK